MKKKTAEMNDVFHVGAHALTRVNIRACDSIQHYRLCNSACMVQNDNVKPCK